jgi:hypothetical protein
MKNPETGPTTEKDAYVGLLSRKCRKYTGRFFLDSCINIQAFQSPLNNLSMFFTGL